MKRIVLWLLAISTLGRAEEPSSLFNGKDLTGWDGDPAVWSVKEGVIRGESTLTKPVLRNTFLIWKDGTLRDFELRLRVRLIKGNSGVQYRSKRLDGWVISGYQMELANEPGKAGFLYEEKARRYLANLGEQVRMAGAGGKSEVYSTLATEQEFAAWNYYHPGEWNDYLIVAKGPYVAHYVNGFKTIELLDEDTAARALEGLLALQVHAGLPMTVEFKDIFLKNL